ncbi:MAG TPA: sigma-54-dependent Fis family transcriptional regulator [Armatimonadetes bacterium]|nr:sigma-54-dependent Fis family transcriptional regulator [Armatimonadota bacterium]
MERKILLVDDEEDILLTMQGVLRKKGYRVTTALNGREALDCLARESFPLVITDLRMPQMSGEELLQQVRSLWPRTAVMVLTGYGSVESAVEAMRQGAVDYLTKPFDPEEILLRIERVFREQEREEENRRLREQLAREAGKRVILGESPQIKQVLELIDKVASTDSTVLITGESGVGKELVASAIHRKSPRRHRPFIKVSCAALPENLLEVELFGHEKGAYTDAYEQRPGRFELADRGTLFLDEIGDISPSVQVKLLRVLQEREFERIGGTQTLRVDVRIIAATNQNLLDPNRAVPFREDLYYRLNVIPIFVPPLRERKGDIPLLAEAFLQRIAAETNRPVKGITEEALTLLQKYPWPGNVRELENAIERAVVLAENEILGTADFAFLRPAEQEWTALEERTLAEVEKEHIRRVLQKVNGNKNRAAEILGIHRETLYNKIKRYKLEV